MVVEEDHAGVGGPEWREEGYAVPDLDESVAWPVGAEYLRSDRPRKDEVAAGPADHPVAGPAGRAPVAGSVGGAERDLEARIGPTAGDLMGMDL